MLKKNKKSNNLLWAIGAIVSVIFGFLAFRKFQWYSLYQVVLSINPFLFTAAGLLMVVSFCLRAYRWSFFLPQNGSFKFASRLSGIAIGYFFSNILPGRLGDLLRPAYLSKTNDQKFKICLYSIVLERVWELVLFIILAMFFLKNSSIRLPSEFTLNYYIASLILIGGFLFLVFTESILRIVADIAKRTKFTFVYKHAQDILNAFSSGIQPRRVFNIVGLTIIVFILEGLFFVCLLKSVGISISLTNGFMVMIISALSIMLPSAPAAIGVFHYFCQHSLMLFGVDSNLALSAAILIHAYMFIFDFLFALVCLAFGPLKTKFLKQKEFLSWIQSH